ncbi:MAG: YceI family protein [Streptomyces sp.]|nr:YceI family protein [Streptomyces sp.]
MSTVNIPGYAAGTWVIDTARSTVSFRTKMLGFLPAAGTFDAFEGTITLAEDPLDSSVEAVVRTTSLNTRNARRDKDLRKEGYLNVERYPTMTFSSTGVRTDGDAFLLDGDFTVLAVTKQLTLRLTPNGFESADGTQRARFTATTEISNKEVGVTKAAAVIRDTTEVTLDIVATRQD